MTKPLATLGSRRCTGAAGAASYRGAIAKCCESYLQRWGCVGAETCRALLASWLAIKAALQWGGGLAKARCLVTPDALLQGEA